MTPEKHSGEHLNSKDRKSDGHGASSSYGVSNDAIEPVTTHNAPRRTTSTSSHQQNYDIPSSYANLNETTDPPPVQNLNNNNNNNNNVNNTLEQSRSQLRDEESSPPPPVSRRLITHLYTTSHLILFSLFGTLARLGLSALTTYPGTPITFPSIWPNFAGSLIMGFLAEDRAIFRGYYDDDDDIDSESKPTKAQRLALKKTVPLYIGLATGFCGSFTSFSALIRDVFLALSGEGGEGRNGGYSFLALLGVGIATVALSLSGLFVGAHLAILLEPITPSLPEGRNMRRVIDNAAVVLGWGCWLGAVLMSIFPPHEEWRGVATFALVFAPLGCLARFWISLKLNGKVAGFPLGTFAVNILGTAVLGMSWDQAHVPLGGVVGCQVLQGVQDGFCGCLTTVSTWVAELAALRKGHAYIYGFASVLAGLAVLVAIMGGLRWSDGWEGLLCTH